MRGPPYWFRAKRYGWGWGLPLCWQGWLVLAAYAVLFIGGFLWVPPAERTVAFVVYVNVISVLLVIICWIKGEPPRWRWGK
jgi:hypothetical protein